MTRDEIVRLEHAADNLDAALTTPFKSVVLDRESAQTIVQHLYPYLHTQRTILDNDTHHPDWRSYKHPNGAPMYGRTTGMLLDEHGNRSIFDDVDS